MLIVLNVEPPKTTAQGSSTILKNKKTGKSFIGKPARSKASNAKKMLVKLLEKQKPAEPFSNAISVELDWAYTYLKSHSKKQRSSILPCTTRPDADNLMKLFFDACTEAGIWSDDSIIYSVTFRKYYCERGKITLKIS